MRSIYDFDRYRTMKGCFYKKNVMVIYRKIIIVKLHLQSILK